MAVRSQRPSSRRSAMTMRRFRAGCSSGRLYHDTSDPDMIDGRIEKSSSKPRDVMPEERAHPARAVLHRRGVLQPRARRTFSRDVDLRRSGEEIARPGQFVLREVAGDSIIITRSTRRDRCTPSTTCAGIAARASAPKPPASSPAAFSAPTTPGPMGSTGGWSARLTWRRSRIFARRTFRCIAAHVDDLGRTSLPDMWRRTRHRSRHQLADLPAKFRPGAWRTCGSAAGSSMTSRRTGS